MNEEEAKNILRNCIGKDGELYLSSGSYLSWYPRDGDGSDGTVGPTLDGRFKPKELEAIAWWVRAKKE